MVRRLKLATATQPVCTPEIPTIGMRKRWCVSIRSGRRHLGYLWVIDGDHRVGADQLPRLVELVDLAVEVLLQTLSATDDIARLRSALLDRLLRVHDERAARELVELEGLPYDALIVVREPSSSGGWALPDGMSAHVWTPHSPPATSGAPLPLVDLPEAVRRATAVAARCSSVGPGTLWVPGVWSSKRLSRSVQPPSIQGLKYWHPNQERAL